MIKVALHGRMGNQLFQFAFAHLMAKKNNTFFILDIQKNRACLQLEMSDLDQNGRIIMLANCVYIGDQYKLNLSPNKENPEMEIREKDVS